ncbi:MAG: hypothetical protein RL026_879 [Pseudomonadota bacterium]|jgi:hypothetical protein
MEAKAMTEAQASLELSLLNAETQGQPLERFLDEAIANGAPPELATRLGMLWEETKVIAGEVIHVGRIIVMRIIAFLKANPALGAALAVASAAYVLSHTIPFIGALIAPIIALAAGAIVLKEAMTLERAQQMARDFFALLVDIFNILKDQFAGRSV